MSHSRSPLYRVCSVLILLTPLFFILSTHIAFADTLPNPLTIRNDATGGDCALVGTWDAGTKTCTLTQDVQGSGIVLYGGGSSNNNGLVLDGAGHSITGTGSSQGVFIQASGVTIKNLTIQNFASGVLWGNDSPDSNINHVTLINNYTGLACSQCSDTRIDHIDISGAQFGVRLSSGSRATVSDVTITNVTDGNIGIWPQNFSDFSLNRITQHGGVSLIDRSTNGILRNLTLIDGARFEMTIDTLAQTTHDIDSSNTIDGKPILYLKGLSDTTVDATSTGALYCISCNNITIQNINFTGRSTQMTLYDTHNSVIAGNTWDNATTYSGTALFTDQSTNNAFRTNTFKGYYSIYIRGTDQVGGGNIFYHNNFYDLNNGQAFFLGSNPETTALSVSLPFGGNYWEHFDSVADGCADTDNDHICDAPYHPPVWSAQLTDQYPWTTPIIPQCKDGIDNDGDGKADTADSGCHTDFTAGNATSYDPLIDNENFMTSQYYTPLQEVTAQLEYPTSTPQGTAPNLLVLVHGCCNNKSNVQETWETLKGVIEPAIIQNAVAGPWEVLVWDWSSSTPKRGGLYSLSDAKTAYVNAFDQGKVLGEKIRARNYKYVHLVGHSAGSNLIDSAVRDLKTKGGSNHPIVHVTFLDAFTPNGSDKTYGSTLENSDFAEQYVLKGDLMWTSSTLPHAYNFNVTGISPVGLGMIEAHSWPVEFYRASAINAGSYGFGLPVSFERSNQGDVATFYVNQKQSLLNSRNIRVGDECLLTSATACAANPSGVVDQAINLTRLGTSAIIGGVSAIKKSITGVVNIIVGEQPTYISAVLNTGSPVWFEIPLNTTEQYNILKFDYEFLSAAGAEGIMTVFVDDNPVFKIDERLASTGTTTTPDIPVGDLAPGQHRVGFRLDPFTDVQSSARVNNIQFGLIHEQAATDVTPPSTPTLLTATPLATSSIKLTWATSTDSGSGIAGYQLFRATSSTATTTLLATTTASTTIFTNTGLTASTTYWYQIKAVDLAGNVSSSSNKVSTTTLTTTTTPPPTTYRIDMGATTTYTDTMGNLWQPDQYFTGGTAVNRGAIAIANTNDDRLYQTERYGMTGYNIPLPNGTYTVTLHFAETSPSVTAIGQRTFNVSLEGATVLTNFDIFAQAGKNTALIKTFTRSVTDGTLNLGFTAVANAPEINGIAVTPADTTPPTTPTNLTAIAASSTQINLTWATSTDPATAGQVPSGVAGYKLERCTGATCTNFIHIATSTTATYNNTGLTASTTYRFRVRAFDGAGNNSGYSTTTTITTQKAPTTIFTDTFESALNWTKVGAVTWYTGTPKVGTHAARLQTTASIEKAISLANYSNITISFRMGANSLDTSSENVQALYYNGTSWITLTTIANGSANENNQLNPYTFTLPSTMNNKSTFKLRFKINGSAVDDYAFIDEVKVVGVGR